LAAYEFGMMKWEARDAARALWRVAAAAGIPSVHMIMARLHLAGFELGDAWSEAASVSRAHRLFAMVGDHLGATRARIDAANLAQDLDVDALQAVLRRVESWKAVPMPR
jgi:hypothetical protein